MTDNFSSESGGAGEDSPLGQGGRRAYSAYNWYSRITTWKARLKTALAWLKTKAGASTAAALMGGAAGVAVAVNPALLHVVRSVPAPVQRWGDAMVFAIDGVDREGRKASFDLLLMLKDYTWALASSTEIAFRGASLSNTEAAARVFSPEVREGLKHSPEIIAVGVASQEGDLREEQERAEKRAQTQAELIARSVSPLTSVWLLNLGQYDETCNAANTADTSWQRPVMLVGVRSQQPGVVLAQALENAINGKSNIPSRACYSNFDMTRKR